MPHNKYIPPCSGKNKFPLLSLIWYLFNVVSGNRHLTRGSNGNPLSFTTTGNVFVTRWVLSLVTRPVNLNEFAEFNESHLEKSLMWQHTQVRLCNQPRPCFSSWLLFPIFILVFPFLAC